MPAAVTVAVEQGTLQVFEGGKEEGRAAARSWTQWGEKGSKQHNSGREGGGHRGGRGGGGGRGNGCRDGGRGRGAAAGTEEEVGVLVVQMAAGEPTAMAAQAAVGAGVGAGGAMAVVVIMRGVPPG